MQLEIRPHELETLLDRAPDGLEILSLDCFDTLIWRSTHAPTDVLCELGLEGSSMEGRRMAESTARRRVYAATGAKEIGLHDVYGFLYPGAAPEKLADAVARELALEAHHAFAFAPAVALIREAKRRGLRVVLVSDMYLTEAELRAHVAAAAGDDVLALVDRVFVSSAYGMGKGDGLFDEVLRTLGVAADRILHVGDNRDADYVSALRHGLHAAHLRQFDEAADRRLRMEAAAAALLDPTARTTRAVCQAHRAQIALRTEAAPATALGHDVIGPVMHAFASWVKDELDAMARALGRPVKPLFVMRDGYLPFRVFDALFPEAGAAKVEISRFVAFRASIQDAATLDTYLAEWLERLPIKTMARQLMLFEHEYAKQVKGGDIEEQRKRFAKFVRSAEIQKKVVARCTAFAEKLAAHLATAGVAPGDAVMLVDIGYNGTVQNVLTPMLTGRLGLTVAGRYLFLRETQLSGLDKRGMLDTRHYDYRALHALSASVVVIEQICNVEQGSTIDFEKDGTPIREGVDAKASHSAVRDSVQQACLAYVAEAGRGIVRAPRSDTLDARCRAAAAALARLFFLPDAGEVGLFEQFDFDMNMGSALSDRLVDAEGSRRGLRREGVTFYADQMQTKFLSAELLQQGLPTGLGMFAAQRFGLDLRVIDFQAGGIDVPVFLATATDHRLMTQTAWRTVDGYYRLQVPIGAQRPSLGIQIGQLCEWVQFEAIEATPIADLTLDLVDRRRVEAQAIPDGMEEMAPDLYKAGPGGLLFVPPTACAEPVMLSLVFRPIRWREAGEAALRAAA